MTAGSTLTSVIGSNPDDMADWLSMKVRATCQPALWHAKFWGQSMAIEEQAWRANMADNRQEGEEPTGGAGQAGEADDMISGCYALNIGIEQCHYRSIWIRAEYIRTYDFLERHYHSTDGKQGPAPGAVLTGQPGIGKSLWIYYALRRRLAERQPFIWYYRQKCYLFVDEGVFVNPTNYFPPVEFKTAVWTFIDSDECKEGIPSLLITSAANLFVVYVTSPNKDRWSRMDKTLDLALVIMNPWTKREIHRAAPLILRSPDFSVIDNIYDKFGPTPRLCFDQSLEPSKWKTYVDDFNAALKNITPQKLEALVDESDGLTMDAISQKFCLLRRVDSITTSCDFRIMPITDFVKSQITTRLRDFHRRDQVRLYKHYSCLRSGRGMVGNVFEAYGQLIFQRKISINYLAMVRLPDQMSPDDETQTLGNRTRQWHSSHITLNNEKLEAIRQAVLPSQLSLNISPSKACEYREDNVKAQIETDVYYLPSSTNQLAFDSFILHDGHLYMFQFSGGQTHQSRLGLITFLKQCANLPEQDRWSFIFIIPDDVPILKCSHPQSAELQALKLFSSILAMEKMQKRSRFVIEVKNDEEGGDDEPAPAKRLKRSKQLIKATAMKNNKSEGAGSSAKVPEGPIAGPSRLH